jgi:predicted ATPase
MLGEKRFLRTIRIRNILSFGPETPELELRSLNVLIGPNGSGKSNLIESVALLQAAPGNLLDPIQTGGGIAEWLWKGSEQTPTAEIDVTVFNPHGKMPLRHRLAIAMVGQRAELIDEAIENERPDWRNDREDVYFYYRYQRGHPVLNVRTDVGSDGRARRDLRREDLPLDQSVLSQRTPVQISCLTAFRTLKTVDITRL